MDLDGRVTLGMKQVNTVNLIMSQKAKQKLEKPPTVQMFPDALKENNRIGFVCHEWNTTKVQYVQ